MKTKLTTKKELTILSANDLIHLGLFPFVVLALDVIACTFWLGWYTTWSMDTLLHFLGGVSIAYSANYALKLLQQKNLLTINSQLAKAIIIVGVVILAAVLWEIYEFMHDEWLGTFYQTNNTDTMKDLIMGLYGGAVYCIITWKNLIKK